MLLFVFQEQKNQASKFKFIKLVSNFKLYILKTNIRTEIC